MPVKSLRRFLNPANKGIKSNIEDRQKASSREMLAGIFSEPTILECHERRPARVAISCTVSTLKNHCYRHLTNRQRDSFFLDAPSQLFKRFCPSVGPSVCPVLFSKVKSTHTRRIFCRVSGLVWRFVVASRVCQFFIIPRIPWRYIRCDYFIVTHFIIDHNVI